MRTMARATWIGALALVGLCAPLLAQDERSETKPEAKKPKAQPRPERTRRRNPWSPVSYYEDRLKLDAAQVEQLDAFYAARDERRREAWAKLRKEGGRFDPGAFRKAMAKARAEEDAKMKEVLRPDQLETFQKLRAQQAKQMRRWTQRSGNNDRSRRVWGRPSLRDQALRALKLDKETQEALAPILDKVLQALDASRKTRGAFRGKIRDVKDPERLKALIAAYRKARDAARKRLADARRELTELLTPAQEAALIALGVLD